MPEEQDSGFTIGEPVVMIPGDGEKRSKYAQVWEAADALPDNAVLPVVFPTARQAHACRLAGNYHRPTLWYRVRGNVVYISKREGA